jgi:hypothetical protein
LGTSMILHHSAFSASSAACTAVHCFWGNIQQTNTTDKGALVLQETVPDHSTEQCWQTRALPPSKAVTRSKHQIARTNHQSQKSQKANSTDSQFASAQIHHLSICLGYLPLLCGSALLGCHKRMLQQPWLYVKQHNLLYSLNPRETLNEQKRFRSALHSCL